jgi:hypothetical protein
MRLREVQGKRIVRIVQQRFYNTHMRRWTWDVSGFELEGGTFIALSTEETIEMPAVTAHVVKGGK